MVADSEGSDVDVAVTGGGGGFGATSGATAVAPTLVDSGAVASTNLSSRLLDETDDAVEATRAGVGVGGSEVIAAVKTGGCGALAAATKPGLE